MNGDVCHLTPPCPAHADPIDEEPRRCPRCGSDDLGVFCAGEDREDEADLVECERCRWTAALTPEGAESLREAIRAARPPVEPGQAVRVTATGGEGRVVRVLRDGRPVVDFPGEYTLVAPVDIAYEVIA